VSLSLLRKPEAAELRLNLGCCDDHLEGFCNVDRMEPADLVADLDQRWPWPDGSVEEIVASDIFEHLESKIHAMNEAWRVLRTGGQLNLRVPTTDGRGAFQDPTHKTFWTPHDLLYYVPGTPEYKRLARHYGIKARFGIVAAQHSEVMHEVWYLAAVLEAVE
jgi:SAM-dependent methyltransferase